MADVEKVVVTLGYMFQELEKLQDLHIKTGRKMLEADNGNIFHFDLFASGIFHRSLMLISGFIKLIPDNFISAAPLVRLQLDNFLRTSAVHRAGMPIYEFAIAVMGGKEIKDFQDKDSKKKLNDSNLASLAEERYPGIKEFLQKSLRICTF